MPPQHPPGHMVQPGQANPPGMGQRPLLSTPGRCTCNIIHTLNAISTTDQQIMNVYIHVHIPHNILFSGYICVIHVYVYIYSLQLEGCRPFRQSTLLQISARIWLHPWPRRFALRQMIWCLSSSSLQSIR